MSDRNLLAISVKHTEYRWKFGMPCILWGSRSKDNENRSFGGYTIFPENAELYSLQDWEKSGFRNCEWMKLDEPVKIEIGFCRKWRKFDTVLIRYDDYIAYCKAANLPLKEEHHE